MVTQALQQPGGPHDRLRTKKFPPGKVCLKVASHPLTSTLRRQKLPPLPPLPPLQQPSPELTRADPSYRLCSFHSATLGPASGSPRGLPPHPAALPSVSCSPTCPSRRCPGDHSKSSRGSLLPEGYYPNSRASPGQAQMALSQPTESPLTSRLTAHGSSGCADPLHAQVSGRTCSFQSSWKAPIQSAVQLKHILGERYVPGSLGWK